MLLQEIRLKQALAEQGVEAEYKICHSEPYIDVFGNRYPLVFPKYMFGYVLPKETDILFIGMKTKSRQLFLNKFDAKIIYTDRGRRLDIKQRDEWYFNEMAKARFVLCPDGDFVWTYRFFESIIFKAIPIVENVATVYNDYRFYRSNEKLSYNQDWINYNRNKVIKEMTLFADISKV